MRVKLQKVLRNPKIWVILAIFVLLWTIFPRISTANTTWGTRTRITPFGYGTSHVALDVYHGYLDGSTVLYFTFPSTRDSEKRDYAYNNFLVWTETASDTWVIDGGYTWTDGLDTDTRPEVYKNTLSGAATAGGEYYLYAWNIDNL